MREAFGQAPEIAVVLGSGLGGFVAALKDARSVPYASLGLPEASVPGHAGAMVVGSTGARRVACFAGRMHLYEGHDAATAVLGVRALARWGVRVLILTSAVGAVDPALLPGEIIVVSDHLNLLGANPLRGVNLEELGPRFPDLSRLYTPRLRSIAHDLAPLREGVYAAMPGPSYETPAEVRMLARLGADVVGMSMVPEAIAAGHAGLEVLSLSVVANAAAGLTTDELLHADVTAVMQAAGARVGELLLGIVDSA